MVDISERMWLGDEDIFEKVIQSVRLPEGITLRDCTLREGEQAADIVFSVEDKIEIAERLKAIGITRIQAGMPGRLEIDKKAFQKLSENKISVEALILAYGFKWKDEIDVAISVGASAVDIVFPCSEYRLKGVMNLSKRQMLDTCQEAIMYAKKQGTEVVFTPVDATRASLQFLREVGKMAVEAGADTLVVADTVGIAIPETMKLIVSSLSGLGIKLGVHTHNDLGLGLANAITAAQSGATLVDVCISGLAERAGGVALDEFVVVVQELLKKPLGIKTEMLYELSKFVERITGFPTPRTKPLVGDQAFAHKSDTHIQAVMKYMPGFQGIDPQLVGQKLQVVLGNLSGPFAIKTKAQNLGIRLEEASINEIAAAVREKALKVRRALRDDEFTEIVSKFILKSNGD